MPEKKLILKNDKGSKTGHINFEQFKIDQRPSLVEYLGEGWKLDVSVAIDFSLSNLDISDYRSLHRINNNGEMN
jgi:hypothetical protein